jgi:diguanylate cyclase (GGDEF)-like protein
MAYFDFDEGEVRAEKESPSAQDIFTVKKEFDSFKLRLHEEILRSQRRKYAFTLMRVEIDPHEDQKNEHVVAQAVAETLKSTIREYDVLCALQSDQFLIAFPETEEKCAEQIAGRIRQTLERKLWADAVDEACEANIGIACFPQDGANAEDLLTSAERDLRIARKMKR